MARTTIRLSDEELAGVVLDAVAPLATQIYGDLVLATPVDTGQLRNSWQLDIKQQIGSDNVVFELENNQPYAERIDEGHSGQAPAGIVDPVLAKYGLNRT